MMQKIEKVNLIFKYWIKHPLYKRQSHLNMTLKERKHINIAACQNHVTHSFNGGGISSQWGKNVLLAKVGCISTEGRALC